MDILFKLVEFFTDIIDVYVVYLFLFTFLNKKEDKTGLKVMIPLFFVSCSMYIVRYFFGIGIIFFIIVITLYCLLSIYLFNDSLIKKLIFILIAHSFFLVVEALTAGIMVFIFSLPLDELNGQNTFRLLGMLFSKLLSYISVKFLGFFRSKSKSLITTQYLISLISIYLIDCIVIYVIFDIYVRTSKLTNSYSFSLVLVVISFILLNILLTNLITKIISQSNNELNLKLQVQNYKQQTQHVEQLNLINNQIKTMRHDFVQHLSCISGLAQLHKYDRLNNYILNLNNDFSKYNNIITLDNPTISSLLNFKLSYAEQNDITFNIEANIPESICVSDNDLAIVLGNTIDNAIEATRKLDKELRSIDLKIRPTKGFLLISISNSTNGEVIIQNNEIKTTKKDKENHGLGLKSIKYIVDKYDGTINLSHNNNIFQIDILFPV